MSFFDSDFKALQVNLSQSTLRDDAVGIMTVRFLIISTEVLDGSGDAGLMESMKLSRCNGSGQIRIFRKIFKVSAI